MRNKVVLHLIACTLLFSIPAAHGYQITLAPRISISEEYTDNYFLADQNKEYEYITTISPGLTAQVLGKTLGADLSYDPEFAAYDKHTENNLWRHSLQFHGWLEPTKKIRVDLRDNFLRTEDPQTNEDLATIRTQDPTAPVDSTIRKGRNPYSRNSTSLNMSYQFGESDSFDMGYTYSFLNNDDPATEDNRRHNPFVGITYWFLPQWGLNARTSYARGEFDRSDNLNEWTGTLRLLRRFTRNMDGHIGYSHTVLNYEGETEDNKTYNPSIGINYAVAEDMSLSIEAGYFINDYKLREDESGFSGDTRFIKRFKRGSINLSGLGGYENANFGAENLGFNVFYEAAATVSYQITRHFSGNLSGSYRNDQYKDIIPEREDKTKRIGVGLTIIPLQWMSIGLNYSFRSFDSTINANDYDENRLTLKITLNPSIPFRLHH